MKKIIPGLFLLLLLTGCGNTTEAPGMYLEEGVSGTAHDQTTEMKKETEAQPQSDFPDFDSITDEQVIQLVLSDQTNADRIPDFFVPDIEGDYRIVYLPEGEIREDPYILPPEHAQNYKLDSTELIADTDLYAAYRVLYTENEQRFSEVQLFPKNFRVSDYDYASYSGGTDESAILQNFDLIAKDQKILCRRFRNEPDLKCLIYDFYAVTMLDDGTAELGWYCYLLDKDKSLVCTVPEWNQKRTVAIPGAVPQQTTEAASAPAPVSGDIWLRASNTEILIGQDEDEIIWYAEIPVDCAPQMVYLINADTGEIAAELFDEADYEKYGDTIKGDSVYNCRFRVNVDIDTDPEVSEDVYYHYYAEFTENGITHRSDMVAIWVVEPFTDKELNDMEAVDEALSELMESEEYQALLDIEKLDRVVSLLKGLSIQGTENHPYSLVMPGSIHINDDTVSFQYACGVGSNVMIKPFDPMMN